MCICNICGGYQRLALHMQHTHIHSLKRTAMAPPAWDVARLKELEALVAMPAAGHHEGEEDEGGMCVYTCVYVFS